MTGLVDRDGRDNDDRVTLGLDEDLAADEVGGFTGGGTVDGRELPVVVGDARS